MAEFIIVVLWYLVKLALLPFSLVFHLIDSLIWFFSPLDDKHERKCASSFTRNELDFYEMSYKSENEKVNYIHINLGDSLSTALKIYDEIKSKNPKATDFSIYPIYK